MGFGVVGCLGAWVLSGFGVQGLLRDFGVCVGCCGRVGGS